MEVFLKELEFFFLNKSVSHTGKGARQYLHDHNVCVKYSKVNLLSTIVNCNNYRYINTIILGINFPVVLYGFYENISHISYTASFTVYSRALNARIGFYIAVSQ